MKCRNRSCDKEIGTKLYCPLCGYANKEAVLFRDELEINGTEATGEAVLWLENNRFHPINAKVSVLDSAGYFSLGVGEEFCLHPSDRLAVKIQYNIPHDLGGKELAFTLCLDSDDGVLENSPRRPREIKNYWRQVNLPIKVSIVEPGVLSFDKGFYTFGCDCRNVPITLTHTFGLSDVIIKSIAITKSPERFKIISNSGTVDFEELVIKKGDSTGISLSFDGLFSENLEGELEVQYVSGASELSRKTKLFAIKQSTIWAGDATKSIPEYIVAIDFGTSKTTAGYIKVDEIFKEREGGFQFPDVEIVKFSQISHEGYADIPSIIGIRGNEYVIGRIADEAHELPRVNYLKMSLQNEHIEFKSSMFVDGKKREKSETRETIKVLTTYLRELKKYFPDEILDADELNSVMYVFTLPVLDNELEDAPRYTKQEKIMRMAAEMAEYGDKQGGTSNIKTLPESEAALLYILNAHLRGDFKLPRGRTLENGDVIGVFDYGAGTLDVSFGRFTLADGIPSIDSLGSIGLFGTDANEAIGGNRVDNKLAITLINEVLDSDKEQELSNPSLVLDGRNPEVGNVVEFESFSDDSPVYPQHSSSDFISMFVRRTKEFFAFLSDTEKAIGVDNINPYTHLDPPKPDNDDQITCEFETFKKVVDFDMKQILETMQKSLSEKGIDNLKYMFTLGGSSLIKHISGELNEGQRNRGIRGVFSPYDYSGFKLVQPIPAP